MKKHNDTINTDFIEPKRSKIVVSSSSVKSSMVDSASVPFVPKSSSVFQTANKFSALSEDAVAEEVKYDEVKMPHCDNPSVTKNL